MDRNYSLAHSHARIPATFLTRRFTPFYAYTAVPALRQTPRFMSWQKVTLRVLPGEGSTDYRRLARIARVHREETNWVFSDCRARQRDPIESEGERGRARGRQRELHVSSKKCRLERSRDLHDLHVNFCYRKRRKAENLPRASSYRSSRRFRSSTIAQISHCLGSRSRVISPSPRNSAPLVHHHKSDFEL